MVLGKKKKTVTCQRIKGNLFLAPYTKINSEQIKEVNVISEATELLKENLGTMFCDISLSNTLWFCLLRQRQQKQK